MTIPIDVNKTGLLIVDMQRDILKQGSGTSTSITPALETCHDLIQSMHAADRPVVFVKTEFRADYADSALGPRWSEFVKPGSRSLVENSPGAQLVDGLSDEDADDYVVIKKGHSAFLDTSLDRMLTNLGVEHCIVAGSNHLDGITSTIRVGVSLGYKVYTVDGTLEPSDAADTLRMRLEESFSLSQIKDILAADKKPGLDDERDQSALLIIDMQNDFLGKKRYGRDLEAPELQRTRDEADVEVIAKNQTLAEAARKSGWPVVFVKIFHRPDAYDCALANHWVEMVRVAPTLTKPGYLHGGTHGTEIVDGLSVEPEDLIIEKKAMSAFSFTPLHRILRNLSVRQCLVIGGTSPGCVTETVREGVHLGYKMSVATDALYMFNPVAVQSLGDYATLCTADSVLEGLPLAAAPTLSS